ncbi:rod shape-determining protein MreD [Streptosporangium saharense]|uniref:Rod shape-determining protein MreD n=1 Tax=Streptosporangium saharense TaxID=1706840 RepID=A0A7W7QM82_9ACTN|nr:rod shape-determining protein MreD [Streptosporangium saharense]MBB4916190.1 rod shape-determining protein MreD [Streptosporangium saharense]
MSRDLGAVVVLLLALLVQVTFVNRLPLPGGAAPDLVLLTVVGYALVRGATGGAVMGFAAGFAGDVLPPAAHVLGQYALVLCLIGFAAGRAGESRPEAKLPVALACAAAGPPAVVAISALLGDPAVGGDVLASPLPWAIGYNLLAAPPVVWLVMRIVRGPRERELRPVTHLVRGRR